MLPQTTPAEVLTISPENLEVANCYLQTQSIQRTAEMLNLEVSEVANSLQVPLVRKYIDNVFLDLGFNNRFKMRSAMDALIQQKFQELEEAQIGSSKDITELLALSHKMSMEHMDREIKLLEAQAKHQIRNQTNVQINDSGGSNYQQLLQKILQGNQGNQ